MPLTVDLHEHLVQVPAPLARFHAFDPALPDLRSKHRAEPMPPEPNRFIADLDAALMQQVLDVAERQRETDVQHHRQADNFRATLKALERVRFRHDPKLRDRPARLNRNRSDKANFYNSSALFDPISPSTQQLILDASTAPEGSSQGPNGFTLDDLFLSGLSTFGDFQSTRKRQDGEPAALRDPVYFNGVDGTLGAGTITAFDVAPVPIPAAAWLFGSGVMLLGWVKRISTP